MLWMDRFCYQWLPIGMAKLLKGGLLFDREVAGASTDATGATAVCRDGSSYRSKSVICALPFSTLREPPPNWWTPVAGSESQEVSDGKKSRSVVYGLL
jgi:hypothetical protein